MSVVSIGSAESGEEVNSRKHPFADDPIPLAVDRSEQLTAGEQCRREVRSFQHRANNLFFRLGLSRYMDQPTDAVAGTGSSSPQGEDGMGRYHDMADRQQERREAAKQANVSRSKSPDASQSEETEISGSSGSGKGKAAVVDETGGAGSAPATTNYLYKMDGQEIYENSIKLPAIGLRQLRKDFAIPASVELYEVKANELATRPPEGKVAFYKKQLVEGLRLPLHPWLADVFRMYNVAPGQVGTNPIRQFIGLYALFHFCGFGEPTMDEVAYIFKIDYAAKKLYGGSLRVSSRNNKNAIVKDIPTSVPDWRNQVFFVGGEWVRAREGEMAVSVPTCYSPIGDLAFALSWLYSHASICLLVFCLSCLL